MTEQNLGAGADAPQAYRKRSRSKKPLLIGAAAAVVVAGAAVFATAALVNSAEASDEIEIGIPLAPSNLDIRNTGGVALEQLLIDNIYQGLIGLEPGTVDEYRPVLATELPEVSEDGLRYAFELRDDVTFHSGSALTADDVVASLTDTLQPEQLGTAATVTSPDERSVVIELDEPNNQLMWQLAGRAGVILEAAADNDMKNTANGTGPYRLDEWREGDSLTFVKNEEYWGEPATLETAVFRFVTDRAAANALQDGDVDVQVALIPTLRGEFEGDDRFDLVRADSTDVFTLAYNSGVAPLDDPRVRSAISKAIDAEGIIAVQAGDGKPLGSPITELEPGYVDLTEVNGYDPEGARELLAEAGHPNLSLSLTVPNHYDFAPIDLLTSQLKEVGIVVTPRQVEFPTWLEEVYTNRDYQLSYVDHVEPFDFANYTNPDYYFAYDDPRVQELYAQSLETTDPAEADRLLQEAARLVAEDAPAKWLFNYTPTNVVGTHVEGFPGKNTNSRINLEGVRVS